MSEVGPAAARSLPATMRPEDVRLQVSRALTTACREQLSGTLSVAGDPGGSFHLQRGAILEVASPGAPGVDTLLLRSGRVSEADWASVVQSGASESRFGPELVERRLVGAAELKLICRMTALDGALAMGMGRIDRFSFDGASCAHRMASPEEIDPEWLLREAEWRIRALRSMESPISPFRDRPSRTVAGTSALNNSATGERREILLEADGRRSSRDIAFSLGRSLYAVTVELARMRGEGLVEVVSSPRGDTGRPLASLGGEPDQPEQSGQPGQRPGATETGAVPVGAPRLPHRRPGASGINDVLPQRPAVGRFPPALLAEFRAADGH